MPKCLCVFEKGMGAGAVALSFGLIAAVVLMWSRGRQVRDPRPTPAVVRAAFVVRFGNGILRLVVAHSLFSTAVVAFISFKIVDLVVGLRVPEEEEREGLDITAHGESAYN